MERLKKRGTGSSRVEAGPRHRRYRPWSSNQEPLMAALRAFLLSSSVALAAVGCGPVGGVEPGQAMDNRFASPTLPPTGGNPEQPAPTTAVEPTGMPEGMDPGGALVQASPENTGAACPIPALPEFAALQDTVSLPDPFLS